MNVKYFIRAFTKKKGEKNLMFEFGVRGSYVFLSIFQHLYNTADTVKVCHL